MQPARGVENGAHSGGVTLPLLSQGVDLTLLDDTDSAGLAHGVFEIGLAAKKSEGFAQRFHVCYLLLRGRASPAFWMVSLS